MSKCKPSSSNFRNGSNGEWQRFLELNEEQRLVRSKDKGVEIWLDKELKKKLEIMKINGLRYPIRYMLNSALTVFLETNSRQVNRFLKQ